MSSFLANYGQLGALAIACLAVIAVVLLWQRRSGALSGAQAPAIFASAAVGIVVFIFVVTIATVGGNFLRLDLVIGRLPAGQKWVLEWSVRLALAVLYVCVLVIASLFANRIGRWLRAEPSQTGASVAIVALFIVVSLPLTELLNSCSLQSTLVLGSKC